MAREKKDPKRASTGRDWGAGLEFDKQIALACPVLARLS